MPMQSPVRAFVKRGRRVVPSQPATVSVWQNLPDETNHRDGGVHDAILGNFRVDGNGVERNARLLRKRSSVTTGWIEGQIRPSDPGDTVVLP